MCILQCDRIALICHQMGSTNYLIREGVIIKRDKLAYGFFFEDFDVGKSYFMTR